MEPDILMVLVTNECAGMPLPDNVLFEADRTGERICERLLESSALTTQRLIDRMRRALGPVDCLEEFLPPTAPRGN